MFQLKRLIILSIFSVLAGTIVGETVGVFYTLQTPQQEFAANDIRKALEAKGFAVEFREISTLGEAYAGKKVVIAMASDTAVIALLEAQGGSDLPELGEQAYALRTTTAPQLTYWILGGDDNGAMYGGLQIAENIHFSGLTGSYNVEESPYLKYRGVKFNIPLDEKSPTYYYNNGGTSHKLAIRHVWDSTFWFAWFDEMARHRYNVLSLWSPHPFTSMVNMEDKYPGIAIQGVTGYDENGNTMQVNNMSIDEKIEYWRRVMEYGRDRGFGIYFCTWNIFLSTAEDKHGLSDAPNDPETRTYLRECMNEFLETYPDLSGFGITVGENMGGLNNRDKEEWAWDTYGLGMMEYAQANPGRDLVFIHRQHQGNVSDMLDYFKPLSDLPNVRFDLSFKYSQAHAHAAVNPEYWDRRNMEEGLGPNNLKSWLTVRNDDFYFLHWADPRFVRDYVNHFPEVGKFVDAFYIGSDGWVFTREFTSKNPYYRDQNALSIQKTWYMQKLWGRISYNPDVPDELFKNHLALHYPEASSEELFQAWTGASRAIRLANEQVTGTWDLDFKWWPEGWTSNNGFLSLTDTRSVVPMTGSDLCSLSNTADGVCGARVSALSNADLIEQLALESLATLGSISAGSNTELMLNLRNLEAMANLSLYNAHKFRAAIYLEQGKADEARNAIGTGYCYWSQYTSMMAGLFKAVDLQRNSDFASWQENDAKALLDYTNLGGPADPNCSKQYPWIYFISPEENAVFAEPAEVSVGINAETGDQSVDSVKLLINQSLFGTDHEYPYSFRLAGLSRGSYTLEAIVYDDLGATDSCSRIIFVYDPSSFNKVPWIEDFTLPDGTTSDEGSTSWTSGRSSGNLYVRNNAFTVNDAGTEGKLTTGQIDISEGKVLISLDLYSEGNLESDDYVRLYKSVDGGPEELIGEKTGNQSTPTSISGDAMGKNLSLIIRTRVSYNSEYYYMDNLRVNYSDSKLNQTINFPAIPPKILGDPDFDPGATASSGLTVSYTSSDTNIASIEHGKIHLISEGITSITALQAGNYIYNPADKVSRTLTVSVATSAGEQEYNIELYPNPARHEVFISVPNEFSISLMDLKGKQIMSRTHLSGLQRLDLKDVKPGIYYVRISENKNQVYNMLVKL